MLSLDGKFRPKEKKCETHNNTLEDQSITKFERDNTLSFSRGEILQKIFSPTKII